MQSDRRRAIRRVRLGREIRELRLFCGFTQRSLAGALGVEMHTVYSWEAGRKDGSWTILRAASSDDPIGRAFAREIISIVFMDGSLEAFR